MLLLADVSLGRVAGAYKVAACTFFPAPSCLFLSLFCVFARSLLHIYLSSPVSVSQAPLCPHACARASASSSSPCLLMPGFLQMPVLTPLQTRFSSVALQPAMAPPRSLCLSLCLSAYSFPACFLHVSAVAAQWANKPNHKK